MAIVASIFGVLGRFAGKFLTAVLGWASTLLFGRVPQSRQVLLAAITFGSLAWLVVLVGVVFPDVGTFLLAFVPVPSFVDETWVRLAMLVAALVIPVLVGVAALFLRDPGARPGGVALVRDVLRGYPLTFALALTIGFLAVIAVVRKVRSLAKRWSDAHVPVIVRPGGYESTVADIERALDQAGLEVTARPAPAVLATPAKLLAAVAGEGVGSLVPDRLVQLTGERIEVTIHPSDIALAGGERELARARAAIASRLTASAAWLTTTAEAQQIEDRLRSIAERGARGADVAADLADVDRALAELTIDYEEWEVLYRMRLQIERDLLRGDRPGEAVPGADAERSMSVPVAAEPVGRMERLVGVIGIALVALDLVLAVVDRRRTGRRG